MYTRWQPAWETVTIVTANRLYARWRAFLGILTVSITLSACVPSNPNTAIALRIEGDTLVAVMPSCARILEGARVIYYPDDRDSDPVTLWRSAEEVDLGESEGEYREVPLDSRTFSSIEGSYEAILSEEEKLSEDTSWIEIEVYPRGAKTFGQAPAYDVAKMKSAIEGVFNGTQGPVEPEEIGMSSTELCSK